MITPGTRPTALAATCLSLALSGLSLRGQEPQPSPQPEQIPAIVGKAERLAIGFRVRSLPVRSLSVMDNKRRMTTTTVAQAPRDLILETTSDSPAAGVGPAVDVLIREKLRLRAEVLYHGLRYKKTIDTYWGTDDSATPNDERSRTNTTEQTRARLWDIPVMLVYGGLRPEGVLSKVHVSGGMAARRVARIRTSTEITNADSSTTTNYLSAEPSRRNTLGAVFGIGFRLVDDFNIKVTPEIRFTRWVGSTFSADTTRSPKSQIEVSIGFAR